jgi:hypothetical protein
LATVVRRNAVHCSVGTGGLPIIGEQ